MVAFLDYLPRGNTLSEESWQRRHRFLQGLLLAHLPALLLFGLVRGQTPDAVLWVVAAPAATLALSRLLRGRRPSSLAVTAGLVACSAALVLLSDGAIEAYFHFFVLIGFIALYQDWVPFLWNPVVTILSHGIGFWLVPDRIFSHSPGQEHPWIWSLVHGFAVLAAGAGIVVFWRTTEDEQRRSTTLRGQLAESNRRRFTADLLVNLARRNQNLIYRQLDLLNRLEEHERDAEQLSHLFQLDHLATRIRRNAESLLVLSGEEPARKWGRAVLLVDVVRASIAEIEELDRVDFAVDESLAVSGRAVADCTHLLAELVENAVHFSPPGLSVMIRTRPYLPLAGAQVLTVEDWGIGMSAADLADANDTLTDPRDVDLATSQRLGLHVVARLAQRYKIAVSLEATPGGGITAVMVLPAALFVAEDGAGEAPAGRGPATRRPVTTPLPAGGLPALTGSAGVDHASNGHRPNGHGADGHGASALVLDGPGTPQPVEGTAVLLTPYSTSRSPTTHEPTTHEPATHEPAIHEPAAPGPTAPQVPPEPAAPPGPGAHTAAGVAGDGIDPLARSPWAVGGIAHQLAPKDGSGEVPGAEALDRSGPAPAAAERLPAPRTGAPDWRNWWTVQPPASTGHGTDPLSDPLEELSELGTLGDLAVRGNVADDGSHNGDLAERGEPGGGSGPFGGLARRTPQASLADELRRGDEAPGVPRQAPSPPRDALRSSSALSRFQVNQRAAREASDGEDRQ